MADVLPVTGQQAIDDFKVVPGVEHLWMTEMRLAYSDLSSAYTAGASNSLAISWRQNDRLRGPMSVGSPFFWLRTLPTKLVFSPIVSELGTEAWVNMLRHTNTIFWQPEQFEIGRGFTPQQLANHHNAKPEGRGALSRFMLALKEHLSHAEFEHEITLVGHSMGTIVLNNLITLFPDLRYENIVYMGAACSVLDFTQAVVPYMQSPIGQSAKFYNLSLHPRAEHRERSFADIPHRGSLLNWLDNFYTDPSLDIERTLGRFENIISSVNIIPEDVRSRIHLKAFGIGRNPDDEKPLSYHDSLPGPQEHTEFVYYRYWEPQYWQPFKGEASALVKLLPKHDFSLTYSNRSFLNQAHTISSLKASWIHDEMFGLGFSYHEGPWIGFEKDGGDQKFSSRYLGVDIDFIDGPFATQTFFGIGKNTDYTKHTPTETEIFVLEPATSVSITLWNFLNVGAGVSYRWIIQNNGGFSGLRSSTRFSRPSYFLSVGLSSY